jgi:hypothetical protein
MEWNVELQTMRTPLKKVDEEVLLSPLSPKDTPDETAEPMTATSIVGSPMSKTSVESAGGATTKCIGAALALTKHSATTSAASAKAVGCEWGIGGLRFEGFLRTVEVDISRFFFGCETFNKTKAEV